MFRIARSLTGQRLSVVSNLAIHVLEIVYEYFGYLLLLAIGRCNPTSSLPEFGAHRSGANRAR